MSAKTRWIPVVPASMPVTGEHVLLFCKIEASKHTYICVGFYAAASTIPVLLHNSLSETAVVYSEKNDEFYLEQGFYEAIRNWDEYSSVMISDTVTHWQPLPEVGTAP